MSDIIIIKHIYCNTLLYIYCHIIIHYYLHTLLLYYNLIYLHFYSIIYLHIYDFDGKARGHDCTAMFMMGYCFQRVRLSHIQEIAHHETSRSCLVDTHILLTHTHTQIYISFHVNATKF